MWWMGVEWEEEERKKKKKMKRNERVAMVRKKKKKKVDLKIGKWCLICFLKCVLVMVGSD
jgi:hypothetical protein